MNLYPNYYSLNNFFINNFNDNFNDYEKFVDNLKLLNFNDTIRVFDKNAGKYTDLNDNYNSRIFLKFENFIVDSYLNIFIISENQLNIQNYVEFPPYILFLIKDKITDRPTINDIEYAKALLKLTKYIIIHNNHNNNDEDIEDSIYLKNQIIQYKSELNDIKYYMEKKDGKIDELNQNITELKLKLRKANFSLMENQNIFSELHIDMCEKDQEIEKQKQEIEKQKLEIEKQKLEIEKQKIEIEKQKLEIEKQKIEINKQHQNIENYESTYIYKLYSIYEGLYIYFSRFRLF